MLKLLNSDENTWYLEREYRFRYSENFIWVSFGLFYFKVIVLKYII